MDTVKANLLVCRRIGGLKGPQGCQLACIEICRRTGGLKEQYTDAVQHVLNLPPYRRIEGTKAKVQPVMAVFAAA